MLNCFYFCLMLILTSNYDKFRGQFSKNCHKVNNEDIG